MPSAADVVRLLRPGTAQRLQPTRPMSTDDQSASMLRSWPPSRTKAHARAREQIPPAAGSCLVVGALPAWNYQIIEDARTCRPNCQQRDGAVLLAHGRLLH